MIEKTGIPSKAQVKAEFPTPEELSRPKAVIECYKEIPCNPCETSCPFDAITVGEDINARPQIDFDACTGCGICVYSCPGLAIMVARLKNGEAEMKVPYEFTPLPEKGEIVNVVDRRGDVITEGRVLNVSKSAKQDRTALVHFAVDEKYLYDAISIEVSYGS